MPSIEWTTQKLEMWVSYAIVDGFLRSKWWPPFVLCILTKSNRYHWLCPLLLKAARGVVRIFGPWKLNHVQQSEFLFLPSTDWPSPSIYPLFYMYICRGDPCQFVFSSCGLVISTFTWWAQKLEIPVYSLDSDLLRAYLGCKWDGFTRGTTSWSPFVNIPSGSEVVKWVPSPYPPKMRSWYLCQFSAFIHGLETVLVRLYM